MLDIQKDLVEQVTVVSINPNDPVHVENIPPGWHLVGKGNYAAVFGHNALLPGKIVKVYAINRGSAADEAEVYKKLASHKSYSELYSSGERHLVLKKLEGVTLYDALRKGIYIPKQVIKDVDEAIQYASSIGLNPIDIHGKNVIMRDGSGYIVDVSDFCLTHKCPRWKDFKKAYFLLYYPLFKKFKFSIPHWMLEKGRKGYQLYLRLSGKGKRKKEKLSG
ncbi:serine/threonine protein kinase [Metabacillus sp. GX 13764]|uniref:serine/threonine protein kinase n=1 Tax=Metabacillus kandeliae TaxID=2900151 RepID=UPI001E3FED50|nr:serine/threonine protein kinase [Metabacillus kandeliae]MCD7035079.1 serine/threonine protein kinase [Metabacillus kandeliae]